MGLAACFNFNGIHAQVFVSQGTNVKIAPGTTVTSYSDVTLSSTAVVDIAGRLVLHGNFSNQNPTVIPWQGTLNFSGGQTQTLTGSTHVGGLIINNTIGLNIEGNTFVADSLIFQTGLIRMGSSNLLLGPEAAIMGNPNSTKMVVTNGTGSLQKTFAGIGDFSFPIGDETGTVDYSPVNISLTAGTIGSGGIIGVKTINEALPGLTAHYLKRYWDVNIQNIQNPTYNASFSYVLEDVVGIENQMRCLKSSPLPATISGWIDDTFHRVGGWDFTESATFSGSSAFQVPKTLALQSLFLEGLYPGGYNMHKASNGFTSQFAGNIADSISVDLNDGNDYATTIFSNPSVYLKTDGTASVELPYSLNGHYYITVNHRNSLSTVSAVPVSFAGLTVFYNFGMPAYVYGGNLKFQNDAYCVFSGDINHDRVIDSTDVDTVAARAASFTKGYVDPDANGDGTVDALDLILADNNSSQGITAKLPDWGGQPCPGVPVVVDIDDNSYNTVLIGNQCWFKENLQTTRFRNGEYIPNAENQTEWDMTLDPAFCYPNNDLVWKSIYGNLYNFRAVSDTSGLCPTGWHVPTVAEADELASYMGGYSDPNLGNKLKSCRQVSSVLGATCSTEEHPRWDFHNQHFGTNDAGFSALPAGHRITWYGFGTMGKSTYWWTSSLDSPSNACCFGVNFNYGALSHGISAIEWGFSVRCIKDN